MNLKDLIQAHCADLGDNYEAIAARLNAPSAISNPEPEPAIVPHSPTLKEVLAVVPATERLAIRKRLPGFVDDVRRAIDTGDADYMAVLIQDAAVDGAIGAETVQALSGLVARTQPDPTWTAMVAGPSIAAHAGLGTVTARMVQAAAHE
jgi:hypothetical protein